jgi:hypothetical protein
VAISSIKNKKNDIDTDAKQLLAELILPEIRKVKKIDSLQTDSN